MPPALTPACFDIPAPLLGHQLAVVSANQDKHAHINDMFAVADDMH